MTKPGVVIGVAADGFSVTVEGTRYWIDQEEDPSVKLRSVFEQLGCNVEVEEEY